MKVQHKFTVKLLLLVPSAFASQYPETGKLVLRKNPPNAGLYQAKLNKYSSTKHILSHCVRHPKASSVLPLSSGSMAGLNQNHLVPELKFNVSNTLQNLGRQLRCRQ